MRLLSCVLSQHNIVLLVHAFVTETSTISAWQATPFSRSSRRYNTYHLRVLRRHSIPRASLLAVLVLLLVTLAQEGSDLFCRAVVPVCCAGCVASVVRHRIAETYPGSCIPCIILSDPALGSKPILKASWRSIAPRPLLSESLTCARTVSGLGTVAQKQIAADVAFAPARPARRRWERWWAAAWLAFPPQPRGRVQGSGKEAALHVAGKRRSGVCQIDASKPDRIVPYKLHAQHATDCHVRKRAVGVRTREQCAHHGNLLWSRLTGRCRVRAALDFYD